MFERDINAKLQGGLKMVILEKIDDKRDHVGAWLRHCEPRPTEAMAPVGQCQPSVAPRDHQHGTEFRHQPPG